MKLLAERWNCMPAQSAGLERFIAALIVLTPVFYLSVPHWITSVSMFSVLLILLSATIYRNYFSVYKNLQLLPVLGIYVAYFFAITISQLGRSVFDYKEYLDQTRWLLGISIFAFLLHSRIDFFLVLRWIAPLIVLFAWFSSTFIIPSNAWGDRATIDFMDPLAFGFMNLSIGLMCLVTAFIELRRRRINMLALLNLAGFLVGVYVSLRSGSRTGWLAFPIVLLIIACNQVNKSAKGRIFSLFLIVFPLFILFLLSSTVRLRMGQFMNEVASYPWSGGVAEDTSVAMRITFYRLGAYYFSESPWFGWGDRGYLPIKDAEEVVRFSTTYTRDFAYNALFHSEWTTQAVRFGVAGIIAVVWVFAVPFYLFFTRLRSHAHASLLGLAFLMCQLTASFSTEIYSSKGMITFSVVIVSGLLASILAGQGDADR